MISTCHCHRLINSSEQLRTAGFKAGFVTLLLFKDDDTQHDWETSLDDYVTPVISCCKKHIKMGLAVCV